MGEFTLNLRRYRLTGDPKWQDRGWRMFTAWIDKCKSEYGVSSVGDVRQKDPKHTDNMASRVAGAAMTADTLPSGILCLRRDVQGESLSRPAGKVDAILTFSQYYYLLQSPPDLISLDDYVFTTGKCDYRRAYPF
jgi:mannosyl-oligosaccharide alpha-1,2-mannosidase